MPYTELQKQLKRVQLIQRSDLDLIAYREYTVEDMEAIVEDGTDRDWAISGDAIARLDLLTHS